MDYFWSNGYCSRTFTEQIVESNCFYLLEKCLEGKYARIGIDIFQEAIKRENLEIIEYLHEKINCLKWGIAASKGKLELIKYFHYSGDKKCTVHTMDWAAEKGHLEIVKYLYEIGADTTMPKTLLRLLVS